ncbi:MAG: GAF domain-containing protein [Gemmatimonadetes bacterium]|nr:GAF domain-containing protein [Gemmatimonadota bacterium]
MKPLLLLPLGRVLGDAPIGASPGEVEVTRGNALPHPEEIEAERPAVLVLDAALAAQALSTPDLFARLRELVTFVGLGGAGEVTPPEGAPWDAVSGWLAADAPARLVATVLRGAFREAAGRAGERAARVVAADRQHELTELTRVGAALTTERDLATLLGMILGQARRLANADAGSLYLVERRPDGSRTNTLIFKSTQNFTLPDLSFSEFTVPIDRKSIAGSVAESGEPVSIADVYDLPPNVGYGFNRSMDARIGYRTQSMLVIPMRTHRAEVVGVLQLINHKRDPDVRLTSESIVDREVRPFDERSTALVTALASQAAVAIENSLLYEDIERLFEGFVKAAVTAIEQRDPTTSGHSGRVATLTVGLAQAVDSGGAAGPYQSLRFSREELRELRYASLLHDFGKVGVREQVLVKQKKLYQWDLGAIRHRFAYLRQQAEMDYERERANYLLEHGRERYEQAVVQLEENKRHRAAELQRYLDAVTAANEPTVMAERNFQALKEVGERTYVDFEGVERPLLEEHELRFLMIEKGNLDEKERREIESHVTHTFRFLERIPWTRELRGIPNIAYGHHEKLTGRGYPRGIKDGEIPVQTRMMTISDIYDALTATDRPYKRAVSPVRALDILGAEAKDGNIDPVLLEAFTAARVFELVDSGEVRRRTPNAVPAV